MPQKDDPHNFGDVPLAAILRVARRSYGWAMREALKEVGCDDIPANGMYVIGGIARTGSKHGEIVRELGLSKQAASQLVDTLVLRGYLTRSTDPEDRRRMNLDLTERGMLAAHTTRAAGDKVDAELIEAVGAEMVAHTRQTLAALIDINDKRFGLPRGFR